MAARLAPPKDPLAFLAAAPPGARLLLAGTGPLLGECRAAAGPGTAVLGERRDVADLLRLADVAVLATRYDACPYFALEAAAAGRPLVAPADAVPRGLLPGVAPYDPLEPGSLRGTLAEVLAPLARERRESLGAAALAAWRESFTPERWVAGMEGIYGETIGGTPGRARAGPP
jgi:glycosyltransferase involved in cell wall biosynthesis